MNRLIAVICVISFSFACQQKKITLTIDEPVMIELLKDLHLAEEMAQRFRTGERDSIRVDYLMDMSQIYNIDTSEIFNNLTILKSDPDLAYRIYTEVYNQLDIEYKELSKNEVEVVQDKVK